MTLLVCGMSAWGSCRALGARVHALKDNLLSGPSSGDAAEHRRLRVRFLRQRGLDPPAADFRLAGIRGAVTLATQGNASEMLSAGWAIEELQAAGVEQISIVGSLRARLRFGELLEREIRVLLETPHRLGYAVPELHALWRAFVEPDPAALEALRRRPPRALPAMRRVVRDLAGWLPRVKSRRLLLSDIDARLLAAVPMRSFRKHSRVITRPQVLSVWHQGDLALLHRLEQWAGGSALERAVVGGRPAYRPTRAGCELLRSGLRSPRDAPEAWLGAHSTWSARPWCVAGEGAAFHLRPLR